MASLGWLHLTDLHHGASSQETLWPNLRTLFLDDLARLHEICGPWDLILFTGDLTQQGKSAEFASFEKLFQGIAAHLERLGSTPFLLAVPGNHDLVRPYPDDPRLNRVRKLNPTQDELHRLLTDADSDYRKLVQEAFANYEAWWRSRIEQHPEQPIHQGLLPGEFSTLFKKGELRLGVIGLNTSAFQLSGGNYQGKLLLSPTQFNRACGGDGPAWADQCDFLLLMTHHPPVWLQKDSQEALFSEIAPPGRFILHLFGHMHEPVATTLAMGGARPWRFWQGCSLFGLRSLRRTFRKVERDHGYAAGRLDLAKDMAEIRLWPRKAVRHQAGHWQIVPDLSFTLEKDFGTPPEPVGSFRRPCEPDSPMEKRLFDAQAKALKEWRVFDFQREIRIETIYVQEILQQALSNSPLAPLRGAAVSPPVSETSVYSLALGLSELDADSGILVVRGRAGSGKSTMLRKWALNVIAAHEADRSLPRVLFLTLRHLGRDSGEATISAADLGRCAAMTIPGLDERTTLFPFRSLVPENERSARRNWLFLCDGLDELRPELRAAFIHWAKGAAGRARIVIASRPKVIEDIGHIPGSREYELCDFNAGQIEAFIGQWFPARADLRDRLRSEIANNPALGELAKIPLLLTCLCIDVEIRQDASFPADIQESAVIRSIVEILLDRWDATKLGRPVDHQRIHLGMRMLTDLASTTHYESEFEYPTILSAARKHARELGLQEPEVQRFLDDLLTNGRLLMGAANRGFAFSHAIFFDFFFAESLKRQSADSRGAK